MKQQETQTLLSFYVSCYVFHVIAFILIVVFSGA